MEVFLTIYRIASFIFILFGGYYVITGVFGLMIRKKAKEKNVNKFYRFAIIIPARNEEKVIGNLIDSLNKSDYDIDKFDTFVIVNNTTDDTKKVSINHGAKVIECKTKVKNKAEVLRYAFNKLKSHKEYDAYIIFDADNVVHKNFLKYMNVVLNNGYRVASGFRDAKNPSDSWVSASYTIFYYIQNVFFCLSRNGLKANATITGTGFMIKKELIDKEGFNTVTLTEDMEFAGICALKNEKIYYEERAIVYDEYPVDFKTSWKQRKRWSVGNLQCMRIYTPKLLLQFLKTCNISNLDMAFNFCGSFFHVALMANLGLFRFYNLLHRYPLIAQDYIGYALGLIIQIIIPIASVLVLKKDLKKLWKGILFFPLFILTWLPINIICLFKKDIKWETIKHDRVIKIEDVKTNE